MEKIYEFVIKIKFNAVCNKRQALHHVKQQLNKEKYDLYRFGWDKSCPTEMEVVKISEIKKIQG